ncbi:MAG: hypothetical protein KDM63_13330 [Verrucomicrobiae bacterium]|nr:hypothetical protein [Verrucomicrobiae bacterium]MCB1088026.1 hypothetical protein [Verrucomicrobiae bacterium]
MIALPADMPLIRVSQETLALCEPAWLSETLKTAAAAADVPEWLADDVSKGIESYLKNHFPGTVIDMPDLFARIKKTLGQLGLVDFAAQLSEAAPPVRISLPDLARRAGPGFELMFFELLKQRFRAAADGGTQRLTCYGLDRCVRQLATCKKWTGRCETLKGEIVAFLDYEHRRVADFLPTFTLSVD